MACDGPGNGMLARKCPFIYYREWTQDSVYAKIDAMLIASFPKCVYHEIVLAG